MESWTLLRLPVMFGSSALRDEAAGKCRVAVERLMSAVTDRFPSVKAAAKAATKWRCQRM